MNFALIFLNAGGSLSSKNATVREDFLLEFGGKDHFLSESLHLKEGLLFSLNFLLKYEDN